MVKKKFIPRPKESARVIKKRWHKKREKVELLAEKIRSLRWNISRDLKSDDEKTCLTALVIAIMDKTSERIGNDSSAANGHFGVTGFNKKHFTVIGNKVHLKYTGKSGVDHEKSFSDEKIAKALKAAIKNSPSKNVFVTSDGFQIKQDKVNRYLEDFLISAKDIRGFSCNNQVVKKLKEVTPEEKETQRKKQFLNIIRSVAKKIGHGSGTLRKHYLLPEIEPNFIEKGKVIEIDDVTKYNNGGAVVDEEKLIVKQKKKIGRPSAKKVEKKVETKKTEEKPKQKEEKVVEKTKKEPDSKVFNHLYKEHHQAWDTMQEIEDNVCEEVCDKYTKKLLSVWDSELKPHFKEEEENLFPFIIEKGNKSEVNELLDEHKELEAIIRIIQKNEKKTDKIKYFCKRLKEHIKKEEKLMSKFFEDPYKKEEKKNGGDVESTVSERFELPEAKSASDVSDNIDKICIQYAHRGMAFVQCESYLNEINKDLAKEFLKQKNISGRDGFKEYVSKRQSIVRSGKGKERSEVLRKIKEEETEKHVDNIFKMAFEQEEEMRKKIEEKKNGGDIENNYVIFFKSNLLNNIVYVKQKAKSENEAVEIVKSLYSFSEIKWIKSFPSPKEAEDGVMFFYEAVRDSFKNPFVSLELSDGKIFFSGFGNNVGFNFMPSFELKNGDKVFKEGYLKNRVTEIKVESDFKFDIQKIIDILKGEEKKNGGGMKGMIEVKPNRYVYHSSNEAFRKSIDKKGLIVKGKSDTWLEDTNIKGKVIFASNSNKRSDWFDSTYDDDIYEIDTSLIKNKWYQDPNFSSDKYIFTYENIPSNAIKLIYKGSQEDSKYLTSKEAKKVIHANNPDVKFIGGGETKTSNLTPEQQKLVRTPEFKAWFGDWENDPKNASKVVDENGEPLVVYHSTYDKEWGDEGEAWFKDEFIFDPTKEGKETHHKRRQSGGIYFSKSKEVSKQFGHFTFEFFLNFRNPIVMDAKGNNIRIFDGAIYNSGNTDVIVKNTEDQILIDNRNRIIVTDIFITSNPSSIKLADGRNVKFDMSNPDVRMEKGGDAEININESIIDVRSFKKAMIDNGVSLRKAENIIWNLGAERFLKTKKQIRGIIERTQNTPFDNKEGDKFKYEKINPNVIDKIVKDSIKYSLEKNKSNKNVGDISSNEEVKQKLINILSGLDEKDLWDFVYHIGNVESNYVDDIVAGYKNWINDLPKHELDMLLWRMKQPYFYQFNPKDNYSTATPVPSKFATYNDFYEKKYKKGGALNPFAICTSSIGKKEGTTKRSDWDKDAMKRYESCVLAVKEKKAEGGELTIKRKKVYEGDKLLSEMTYDEAEKYMNIFHEKKGNFMIPKNFFVAWMYDETNFSDKINSGEYDFLLFPPPIKYQTFRLGYGVVDSIWKANFQKLKGAKHLLGMVQGWYDEENKKAVVQYMSVRPSAKRNKINTFLVKGVKKFFETDEIEFDEPTKEGTAFMEGKTYRDGGQVKNFMKISNQEGEQVGVMRYETNDPERNVTIADMAALAIEAGYKVEPISESEFENAKHSFNNKLLQKFQHDVDVVSGREIKIQDPDQKKNGGDVESSQSDDRDYYNDYFYGGDDEDGLKNSMVSYIEENAEKFEKSFPESERFVLSHEEKITFRKQTEFKEELGMKPKGLWYGLGMNWIYGASRFARHLADTYEYIHKLTINESRVCILDTPEKYVEFTKKYGEKASPRIDWMFINWNKVSKDYSGIETHNPRGVVGDLGRQVEVDGNKIDTMSYFNWLLSWDVSGGCIWAEDAIKSIDLVFDWKLHKVANMKSGGGLFDENYAIAYRSIRGDWKPEYKGWQYYSSDKDYSQVWGRNTKKFKIDLSNALNLEKWNELMREAEPSDTWKHFQIGDLQIEQKYFMQLELLANRLGVERYHEFLNEFENSDVVYGKEAGSNTITYAVRNQKAVEFIGDEMANGGSISDEEKSELYSDWRELINMSASELEKFYNSEEGKEAGLSKKEADDLGIHSGRESAKWIMKMKKTPNKDWTPKMWEWAKRQISFVKRMKGNKGDLIDGKGNKTRKHLALLIWGHNPKK